MSAARRRTLGDRLASARLAAWLIALLAAYSLLGFLIPQRSQLTPTQYADFERANPAIARVIDALGLDSAYASVPMLAIVVLLAANITVCTWRRYLRHRKAPRASSRFVPVLERALASDPETPAGPAGLAGDPADAAAAELDRARRQLEARGWRCAAGEGAVLGIKGRNGFWGSVLLHASLLVVFGGAIWSALTGFGGTLVITEGQTVPDEPAAYTAITRLPRVGDGYTGASITLERMEFAYEGDAAVSVVARVSGLAPGARETRSEVRVNYPLTLAGKSYLLRESGLAADVTLAVDGASGQRIVLNLAEKTPIGWQDEFPLGDAAGRTLRVRVAPEPLAEGEEMPAADLPATRPQLKAQVVDARGAASETITLAVGETATTGGVTLTFHGSPVWSTFLARGDRGRLITYAALWACVIGIAWRFFVPERRIAVAVQQRGAADVLAVGYRVRPWIGSTFPGDAGMAQRLLRIPAEERSEA